ncbi:uncharacterized protein LOC116927021 isoform X2 [Daphnia magna]|uniref:uncharacterized protein LOC116927021 isoform X2 n=1 Tax=Daphnia magna TaxID=35525 RepID=UPI001402D4F2|nr:uncharacterized protein LOC116927021 isoform X2 [Daphnia magna]
MSSHRSHHPDNTKTWLPFQFEVAPSDPYESKQKIMIQIQRNVQNLGREPLIPVFMFKYGLWSMDWSYVQCVYVVRVAKSGYSGSELDRSRVPKQHHTNSPAGKLYNIIA